MEKINFFKSVKALQFKKAEVQKVLQQIKKGHWKKQINDMRYHLKNGNENEVIMDDNIRIINYFTK